MTIVASNSLTVSNVNDGTITHIAYANSADGTDGFTNVYPNLNLGDNTKTFVGAEGGNNLSGSIRIDPATQKTQDGDFNYLTYKPTRDNSDWFRFFLIPDPATPNMTKVTVIPNTNYTFSVWLKGTGQHTIYAYNSWTAPNTPWSLQINITSDWKLYTFTVTSKDVIPNNPVQFFIRSNNGTEINLKKPKVEPGSTATPYMPSASEVTTADWPSYIGQYLDFTSTASTNPTKYAPWTIFKGNDGRGIISSEQKYQLTQTLAKPVDPWDNSVWQTTQPTTTATNKYLWSITRTTFNLAPLTQDIVEQKAVYGNAGKDGDPGTSAINIDLSNKSYNFLANLKVSDSGSVMQAVAGSTTTTFTALQGTTAINITALTCTTTLPTGMTVSIGTLNALSVVVTISVDNTMITPNGLLNFSITAGGVTTTKSFSYSLAINDLTVINLAAINSNLGNVKNIYSNYNGSDGGTYSGTIEINDENIKITATNDNDSNEVSKTQMNGENGIWHSTKLQKTNSPGVYVLSNWSLTGTTLSFESQQSDLTYPNGYSYASYGIDMHARNIVGDSISQTTDVPWTDITRASGVGTSGTLRARINNGVFYAQSKDVTIPSIAPNSIITIGTMSSKFSSVSGFDTLGLLYSPGQLSVASVTVGNDGKINIGNPNPTTMSGKVIQFSINIPLG